MSLVRTSRAISESLSMSQVPVLDSARRLAGEGIFPGGTRRNLAHLENHLVWDAAKKVGGLCEVTLSSKEGDFRGLLCLGSELSNCSAKTVQCIHTIRVGITECAGWTGR